MSKTSVDGKRLAEFIGKGDVAYHNKSYWICIEKREDFPVVFLRFKNIKTNEKISNWFCRTYPAFQVLDF